MATRYTASPCPGRPPPGYLIDEPALRAPKQSDWCTVEENKLKILIVEDEFFIALDIEEQARSLGHIVVGTAVTADEAVKMAGEMRPDVVLMDIRLGGATDGIAAALAIRSRYGIESIFVTANTDPHTLTRAEAIKPLGVLEKPITLERLRRQLIDVDRHGCARSIR
jgi:two-component system, response regulator PdtaR